MHYVYEVQSAVAFLTQRRNKNYKASNLSPTSTFFFFFLPSFDLPLSDSSGPVLSQAQAEHSEEDVEGVG